MDKDKNSTYVLAIRIRGTARIRPDHKRTFEVLRLNRNHCATLLKTNNSLKGMLTKAKDWITWGEIKLETLQSLLQRRGRVKGGRELNKSFVKEAFDKNDFEELSVAILNGEIPLSKIRKNGLDTIFRLHPPRGGFKGGIKRQYNTGGELGYRGDKINDLIIRML